MFFLGGYDLEMVTIRDLLRAHNIPFCDRKLSWGATASQYEADIRDCLKRNIQVVLIELPDDLNLVAGDTSDKIILIDHHNEEAGAEEPTALEQVFQLLKLPETLWTRHFELVAANDRGHIQGMLNLARPASQQEVSRIRAADRAAQGVTPRDEELALAAISDRQELCDGRLTVVLSNTSKSSAITDVLDKRLGGTGYQNLLIVTPESVNVFGSGQIIAQLNSRFCDDRIWFGGNLPESGFWGSDKASAELVRQQLIEFLEAK